MGSKEVAEKVGLSTDEVGFKVWLTKHRFRSKTEPMKIIRAIRVFKTWMMGQGMTEQDLQYQDIMRYIDHCKSKGNKHATLIYKVRQIKYYLDYRDITPNPCKGWQIKKRPFVLPPFILSQMQLVQLYNDYPQDSLLEKQDKVMLGLMVFQGIMGGDLQRLTIHDVNLEIGFIIIRKTMKRNSRSMDLSVRDG